MRRACFVAVVAIASVLGCRRASTLAPAAESRDAGPQTRVELTAEGLATADIKTQKLTPGAFVPRARLLGSITGDPKRVAQVGARVSGRVTGIRVALGDRVKRGQDLVEVDTVELHQTVLEYRIATAKSRAAADALTRQRQLADERVGATQDLRRAESEAAAAAAAVDEAREHLKFLGLNDADVGNVQSGTGAESKSRISSPIAGRVASLSVTLGQTLAGTETVAVISDVDEVSAQLRVYERDLADVRAGALAAIEVPAYPNRTFDGKVTFVSEVLDPISRTADLRVSLTNPTGELRPGMSATALVARANVQGIWIPVTAVQTHDGASVVFVRVGERAFDARRVVVGAEQGGFAPLMQGIGPNDDVVVQGAFALRGELERSALGGD